MTLLLRNIQVLVGSLGKKKMETANQVLTHHFRVLPFDLDQNFHMNNAKFLHYFEAGRLATQIQSGFLTVALKRGWFGPIQSQKIEYYRPLKLFQKFKITTQMIAFEKKWFWFLHQMYSNEKEVARCLVKGTVRKGRVNIEPAEYVSALGYPVEDATLSPEIKQWFESQKS